MNTTSAGLKAEQAVADELKNLGYIIIDQNWKTKFAEVDIIALKDQTMYFVEVKFRRSDRAGDGFDYITPQKLHHMERAAGAWVQMNSWEKPYELLAAAVIDDSNAFKIDIRTIN
jgi:putative endonuclease